MQFEKERKLAQSNFKRMGQSADAKERLEDGTRRDCWTKWLLEQAAKCMPGGVLGRHRLPDDRALVFARGRGRPHV